MKPLPFLRLLAAVLLLAFGLVPSASAAVNDLLFTVSIDNQTNTPTFTVTNNSPTLEITDFKFTIGDTGYEFDSRDYTLTPPPGGTAELTAPSPNSQGDYFQVKLTNFGPGETFTIRIDIDNDGQNNGVSSPNVFFNNGAASNSVATVFAGAASAFRNLPENPNTRTFRGPGRQVVVSSRGEEANEYVRGVVVKRNGVVVAEDFDVTTIEVDHGDRIQIVAPQEVYKDIYSKYLDATAIANPDEIKSKAEEKYVALGMTVNNVAQTADPTNYDFEITQNTEVLVKWEHYYALTIRQDFSKTRSQEVVAGKAWAGPIGSDAAGNPSPAVSKHWFLRGSQPVVQIDGQSLDTFSHPGLDLRHVVKGYRAYGPPNNSVPKTKFDDRISGREVRFAEEGTIFSYAEVASRVQIVNGTAAAQVAHGLREGDLIEISGCSEAAFNGVHQISLSSTTAFTIAKPAGTPNLNPVAKGVWRNITYITDFPFANVEQRQQIKPPFTMYGPGGITFYWQIQYGVRVSADDISRLPLAHVYEAVSDGNGGTLDVDRTVPDGVSWFDPGTHVKVVAAARESGADPLSLTGWVNGDGYYFAGTGEIDPSNGLPVNVPPPSAGGSPIAAWLPDGPLGARGYEIPNLQRPVRTLWRYGAGAIVVNVTIGKHAFEDYPQYASMFTRKPEPIINAVPDASAIAPGAAAPGAELMAEWDPVSARLYPTIPGRFTVPWKPGLDALNPVEVRVVATLPIDTERQIRGHYPHIQGSPPVALDPDPADDFAFKSIKYSTAQAAVDGAGNFTTGRAGFTVLLFSQLQSVGRGQPREFLKVRVVDTRLWDASLQAAATVVPVGSKILDPTYDLAGLGTGHLLNISGRARYNPFIYNAAKLKGLAARNIYDMDRLRADSSSLVVVNKAALPGPIIPVNEAPGAADSGLPIVVWYDDPRRNDELMWPYVARIYRPAWPTAASVPQIVIASQYGSEGKGRTNADQLTAPAIGDFPTATTYDPSRLQAVQIYQQPNRAAPGYNPNEEHALLAPSLRFAAVSPRPPAAYALRAGDLNNSNRNDTAGYTSHPFVLVQFHDDADDEVKMNLYTVRKESGTGDIPAYRFAGNLTSPTTITLKTKPYVGMRAGEPVIPFYPLGVAIGASPAPETFGNNFFPQETYWEDWRGSYWSISGGDNAWFEVSFYYPLAPDFWWPAGLQVPPVKVTKNGANFIAVYDDKGAPKVPRTGDSVAFLPDNVRNPANAVNLSYHTPTRVIYKSEWPENPAILKAGETLTFSGGEFRADNPTRTLVKDGKPTTVDTPGLPQVVAFASAEVVFDSLNAEKKPADLKTRWTARAVQVLEKRTAPLAGAFPSTLQPASGRTTVKQGKYVFNELPASLQRRLRFNPLDGTLELNGLLNDKNIGAPTLTAAPPAVYVLEPNIMTAAERDAVLALVDSGSAAYPSWSTAVDSLYLTSRDPENLRASAQASEYLAGLMKLPLYNADGSIAEDELGNVKYPATTTLAPLRAFGPGLALVPNAGFLDPNGVLDNGSKYPDESWVTVVENNDPAFGGSPITPHIVKVDRRQRYRGSVKTILSDNVFDENIVLRSTGDFGANADELTFEWWYRPDDGSLSVPPPDLIPAGQTNPWKLFPDPSGKAGSGRYQITLKGNPNAPEALLADTLWFMRYRHKNDVASGTNWKSTQPDGRKGVNFTWAGAGNSQPFVDADLNGFPDYRPQLAQGWIKRVLDAVNPYEARIRDFVGDSPATQSSMLAQFGPRYEGPVALNPAKNVIENVGLIELYETVLNRGRNLSVNLSQPVSTPAISNALQLASTRISDFYTLLGNEAYGDSLDPTIGYGSDSVDYGTASTSVFTFQNQMSSPMDEELSLLRGVDDNFARPVYNRLFWNFTKGEGEAAYATNYNVTDVNADGFIDEHDAMLLFPQGHGDAWGHYLTALRNQYDLLRHPNFNWVSRAESYNLQDIVITVDFLDERKFAATAAAKAKTGAEIVALTYRDRYVADPQAQWQGYTDSNPDRAWGVDEWARRAGQGAYFDWVTANALLPSEHPNKTLEGIRKVDRKTNGDIAVISANLSAIQRTMDQADRGYNPLGLARGSQVFDLDPMFEYFGEYGAGTLGKLHFDQIYERMSAMLESAGAIWDAANERSQMVRRIGTSEAEFRNSTFQEDLSYRNRLIQIFGKPYAGTIGSGKLYPPGYEGPDLALFMYVPVRQITRDTVPQPSKGFADFSPLVTDSKGNPSGGELTGGDLYKAFLANNPDGSGSSINGHETSLDEVSNDIRALFNSTFSQAASSMKYDNLSTSGLFSVSYTDLVNPKVGLENFTAQMPVTAAGYTFQAPPAWGARGATGELQGIISQMIQQEAEIAKAVGAWDALSGESVRILRLINAKLTASGRSQGRNEVFSRVKLAINDTIKVLETAQGIGKVADELVIDIANSAEDSIPRNLPTAGLSFSPGDALSAAAGGIGFAKTGVRAALLSVDSALTIGKLVAEISLDIAENELALADADEARKLDIKEWIKELEDKVGDEPVLRIAIFKEIQALRELSDRYRTLLDEGGRLVDERSAFNKRVAAQTQLNRYQDMTFRVARNHALQTYRSSFDLASRYAYLAASAYDYETNYAVEDPASPVDTFGEVIRSRSLGSLGLTMSRLKQNYDSQRGQLGFNNPQRETGEISMRGELLRILPHEDVDPAAPANEAPTPGEDSDAAWKQQLQTARVADLWQLPEFRNQCRPFAAATDAAGKPLPQPGIVLRFSSDISSGKNFFGKPLSGGDQAYSTSNFATKIVGVGVAFQGYRTDDVVNDLSAAPRIYFVPAGIDIMRVSRTDDPNELRLWKVVEQAIPVPFPTSSTAIQKSGYIPLLDGLNGRFADQRRFSDFRAYPDELGDAVKDTRLVGRSIWNTQWVLIIPGATLNADPETGLDRFVDQVTDIKLIFDTYGQSGG